jgi:hypothetical protein
MKLAPRLYVAKRSNCRTIRCRSGRSENSKRQRQEVERYGISDHRHHRGQRPAETIRRRHERRRDHFAGDGDGEKNISQGPRYQEAGDKIVTPMRSALNLFSSGPDLFKPGILHHSGNRPAPPSDYTPLARRSAFPALAVSPRHAFISSAHFRIRSLALR